MSDTLKDGLGVVVLAPPSLSKSLKERFSSEKALFIHETTNASQIKLVNRQNENQHLIWVSSCTQQNFINGIGVHGGLMLGYARNANKAD